MVSPIESLLQSGPLALPTFVALLAPVLWSSYVLARQLFPRERTSLRLSATIAVALWLLTAVFYALAFSSAFRLLLALGFWVLLAFIVHRKWGDGAVPLALLDLRSLQARVRELAQSRLRWLYAALAALFTARLLRGLTAPPLGWDALTYHFVKAGRWVQSGTFAPPFIGPDSWGFYEYFSPGGEIFFAWGMLPAGGDGLVALSGALLLLATLPPAYALARELGAKETPAVFTMFATAFTPTVINHMTGGYVDTATLAWALPGFLFMLRAWRVAFGTNEEAAASVAPNILLALGSLGGAAGVKLLGLPLLGLGVALGATILVRGRLAWRPFLGSVIVLGIVFLPAYWLPIRDHGSPFYPMALEFGGRTLLPGHPDYWPRLSGKDLNEWPPAKNLLALMVPNAFQGIEHLNFGPALVLVLILASAGSYLAMRDRAKRPLFLILALFATLLLAAFLSSGRAQLTFWPHTVGRFLMPAWALLLVLSALPRDPRADLARKWTLIANALLAIPIGWCALDLMPVAQLGSLIALSAFAGWALYARTRRPVLVFAAALATAGISATTFALRERERYPLYARAQELRAYDVHWLEPEEVGTWPVWKALDGKQPRTLAVTAGWRESQDNWNVYPLMGSRLQNRLVYVSPLIDGSTPSYRHEDQWRTASDAARWRQRLFDQGVDVVVALSPLSIEAEWMAKDSSTFEQLAAGSEGTSLAYRVHGPSDGEHGK